MKHSLGDLRAIAHALCEKDNIKKQMIDDLRALHNSRTGKDIGKTTDHVTIIEQATAQELLNLQLHYCKDEDIKKRVQNYLQVLRHTKPAEPNFEAGDPSSSIKNAAPKELHNVVLALCEDEDVKKRVAIHLRVLRRSKTGGIATAATDPAGFIKSATQMELRAIGLAMSDADEDVRKRLLESLQVLSIYCELQDAEAEKFKKTALTCLHCKQFFHEKDNKANSCTFHPGKFSYLVAGCKIPQGRTNSMTGRVESGFIPGMDLPMAVDRWSCCYRPSLIPGCKTQKHNHRY